MQQELDDTEAMLAEQRETADNLRETWIEASSQLMTTTQQLGQFERENGTLRSENTDLTNRVRTLDGVVNGLEAQNEGLSTTLSSLEERIGELKAEIDELESRRRALLVRSEVTEILCTGSMEPALTCLDSVTILTNFRPEDIVVGSIISFFEDGDTSTTPFLHRVLERKVENGVNYFWPQGDAADGPDGYWVPEDWVEGYVTELHKNSHPENTELRNEVLPRRTSTTGPRHTMKL